MSERISGAELADCIEVARQEVERYAAHGHGRTRIKADTLAALRELADLREEARRAAVEIGALRAAVEQSGREAPINTERFRVGGRVVFRHPHCTYTPSDHGTVVATQPLTVKWDGDITSRPNPDWVFHESGPLPGGDA